MDSGVLCMAKPNIRVTSRKLATFYFAVGAKDGVQEAQTRDEEPTGSSIRQ